MYRHPYFDLWLHETGELDALLCTRIVARTTVHEWPLSCVQRLRLADGGTLIYKAQAQPTIEPEFYATARSPLLANARLLDRGEGPAAMVLDDIAGSPLAEMRPAAAEALHIGETILAQIAGITALPPLFADISTAEKWGAYAKRILDDLIALVGDGTFRKVDPALVDNVARKVEAPSILEAIGMTTGCVHHDLGAANVFVVPDGYRVIDWQRPLYGPVLLDLAALLRALGVDPGRYVPAGIMELGRLLSIAWFAQCARRWFPPGATTYDATIARLASQLA